MKAYISSASVKYALLDRLRQKFDEPNCVGLYSDTENLYAVSKANGLPVALVVALQETGNREFVIDTLEAIRHGDYVGGFARCLLGPFLRREDVRQAVGREVTPSAAIIDSQSVKTTEKGGPNADTTPERK